jgi:hypothetical protein
MTTHRDVAGSADGEESAPSRRRSLDEPRAEHLERLPHDLAAHVLCMLPPRARARCAAVCRSWRTLVRELPPSQLWRELDFTRESDPSSQVRLAPSASVHPRPKRPPRRGGAALSLNNSRPPTSARARASARPSPPDRPVLPPNPPSTQVTREVINAAAGLARGHLRALRVPGEATVTRASLVSTVRAHRESLRELHAHASHDGERGWWTPKQVHALVSAASPKFRRLAVDVRSRGVCPALVSQLQSPVVRVRRLDVRAASLAPAEKTALFDATRRLRGRAAEMRRSASSQSLCDEAERESLWSLPRSRLVSYSNPDARPDSDSDPDPDALRSVAVSSCGLDGDDAAALAEAVGVDLEDDIAVCSSSAMDLYLSDNPGMGCRGASALAPLVARGAVASLDLENCGVGEAGAAALAEALASPRCALRRLNLSRNFIGSAGVRRIAEGAARGAAARSARPSDGGASLVALLLGHNAFGCDGAAALAEAAETSDAFAHLEVLDAAMNGVGPAGVAALARGTLGGTGAPALRELRLAGNPVGAAGARALARACATEDSNLPSPTLETLTLGSARLGVVGAAAVAWAMSRPRGRLARVARLDLSANDIGECGAALRVTGGEIVGFVDVENVEGDIRRGENTAGNADDTTENAAQTPTALSSLADDLASSRSLRRLDLGYNSLGDAGAVAVADAVARAAATQARDQDEDQDERGGGGGASSAGVDLDLQRNSIGDAGALALAEALGAADALGRRLARVDLRSNAVGEAGLSALDALVAAGRVASNYMPPRWGPRERVAETEVEENIVAGGVGGVVAATA